MTNKSIKFLAASAIALTSIGATSVLTSPEAFASSVTQKSGDENKGKILAVTNPFKTFEAAESFLDNQLKPLLKDESYKSYVLPATTDGYVVDTEIDYGELTPKSKAEALANQVISAADTAIAGAQPAADKPAEKPAETPAAEKPAEKPADKPAEAPAAEKPAEKPAETPSAEKPADKPADKKDDATKPADKKDDATKPADKKDDATKPADKKDDATKPADKKDDATKPADKKDDAKVTDATKKSDAAQAQKVAGKETLPKTAATSGSVANTLVGVVAVAAAAFFGLKRKIFN